MFRVRIIHFVTGLTLLLLPLLGAGASAFAAQPVYEKCTPKNDYLERSKMFSPIGDALDSFQKQIKTIEASERICVSCGSNSLFPFVALEKGLPHRSLHPLAPPTQNDLRCVALVQKTYQGGGGYADCPTPSSEATRITHAPCVSSSYVELTTRAFNLAAACTRTDRRELFGLFAQESGFHLNALSHTKAGGIGQMTSIAIRGVQEIDRSYVIAPPVRNLANSIDNAIHNDPLCSPLKEAQTKIFTNEESRYRCQILSFPRNPLTPMLLSIKHYAYTKKMIENLVSRAKPLAKFDLAQRDQIATDLAYYAYNGGVGGVWASFETFLKTPASKVRSAAQLSLRFKNHLLNHYPYGGEAKRREIAHHVYGNTAKKKGGIHGRAETIDEKAGYRCFE